ncbi:hypothetical protein F2P81_014406 [Scophthalmus maximus]|uniref:Uncharacterized protein n=1 Tax=Scophthalmus maximus TaxID=52904 RepID=A0A6A4SR18_SCOMX|nr:hypothetical protein F2P81_014406 [Scophthalmus maximus]
MSRGAASVSVSVSVSVGGTAEKQLSSVTICPTCSTWQKKNQQRRLVSRLPVSAAPFRRRGIAEQKGRCRA